VKRLSCAPAKTANMSSERPVMMPGRMSGRRTMRRKSERLAWKVHAIESESGEEAERERECHGTCSNLQAVPHRIPDGAVC